MQAPQRFRTLADVEAQERQPYAEAIPARTTYGLLTRAEARFGDRTAFTYLPDGDPATPPPRITYRELLAQVRRAANLFRSLGVGPDDAVALLAPNVPSTQFALWGAQLAGRVCPINYMLQPEHIGALLEASGAKVVVALGPHPELDIWSTLQRVPGLAARHVLRLDPGPHPHADSFERALAAKPVELAFDPQLTPERVAALFHTGGTTGAPKLVRHTHGNEAHTAWFAHRFYDFDERTVEINGFPLFHVAGTFVYGLSVLAVGGCQVLPTVSGLRHAGFMRNYWKFCERERVTALAAVPTVLAGLCTLPVDADIASVKIAYTGGSPLPAELAARFEAARGIAVRNILGMTECAGLVTIEPALAPRVPGSAGLRLPYTEVRVVPWRGEAVLAGDCAPGETGVIVLRGPHVSPGYTDPARDAGMFEQGWLVSGDLGHLDAAGWLHVTGRAKDLIIRGSHNIDPQLVEEAFLRHPAVALCAVVSEPDAHSGEVPAAFVTLHPGAAPADAQALLAEVAPTVYERPAVPKRLVVLEQLPLTAVGKIYKPALRAKAVELKLQEVLAAAAGGVPLAVRVREQGGSFAARVEVGGASDAALVERLRTALGAIAVPIEFHFTNG